MKEYTLSALCGKDYDGFLLCLSFESVLNYLDSIETEPLILNGKGVLLIDQLLVSGNGQNRFFSCLFDHGEIDLSTAQTVFPAVYYRELAVKMLQKDIPRLEYSILTNRQKECIGKGVPI